MIGSVSVNEAFINIICNSCWNDWIENQTKIINEYKLDFSLKEHRDFIRKQMKTYLTLSQYDDSALGLRCLFELAFLQFKQR